MWGGQRALAGRACSGLAVRLGESGGCQERGDGEEDLPARVGTASGLTLGLAVTAGGVLAPGVTA
jgi:hypothetical protein